MATLAQIDVTRDDVFVGLPMPLNFRPPAPMTDEEMIAFSRRNRPYQIERNAEGELEIMSPVGFDGGRREAEVARQLGNWTEQNGGVYVGANTGFNLPDTSMRCPDAAWISEITWQSIGKEARRGYSPVCPEFLIEILSESDSRSKLEAKMEMWIANGVKLAWMIDPYRATVSIYRPNAEVEVLDRPGSVEAGDPVPGFRLSTLLLWDE
jgi:Uma2 family endonuclease